MILTFPPKQITKYMANLYHLNNSSYNLKIYRHRFLTARTRRRTFLFAEFLNMETSSNLSFHSRVQKVLVNPIPWKNLPLKVNKS